MPSNEKNHDSGVKLADEESGATEPTRTKESHVRQLVSAEGQGNVTIVILGNANNISLGLVGSGPEEILVIRATTFITLANVHLDMGHHEDACMATAESIKVLQGSKQQYLTSPLLNAKLVETFNSLAMRLRAVGRIDDALKTVQFSASLNQRLHTAHSGDIEPTFTKDQSLLSTPAINVSSSSDLPLPARGKSSGDPVPVDKPHAQENKEELMVRSLTNSFTQMLLRFISILTIIPIRMFSRIRKMPRHSYRQGDRLTPPVTQGVASMTDVELAATAVTALTPYLTSTMMEAAKEVGKNAVEGVGKFYQALKRWLTSPAATEALADLAKAPNDADAQAALRVQIRKQLEANPAFREELRALVATPEVTSAVTQAQTVGGTGNVAAQVAGEHNNTKIQR